MATPLRIVMIEESPDDAELALALLVRAGYEPACQHVNTEEDFLAAMVAEGVVGGDAGEFAVDLFRAPHGLALLRDQRAAGGDRLIARGLRGRQRSTCFLCDVSKFRQARFRRGEFFC